MKTLAFLCLLIGSYAFAGGVEDYSYVGTAGDIVVLKRKDKKIFVRIMSKIPKSDLFLIGSNHTGAITSGGLITLGAPDVKKAPNSIKASSGSVLEEDTLVKSKEQNLRIANLNDFDVGALAYKIGDCLTNKGTGKSVLVTGYESGSFDDWGATYYISGTDDLRAFSFVRASDIDTKYTHTPDKCNSTAQAESEPMYKIGACIEHYNTESTDIDVKSGITRIYGKRLIGTEYHYSYCVSSSDCNHFSKQVDYETLSHEVPCPEELESR
jgi:hypothetical protein